MIKDPRMIEVESLIVQEKKLKALIDEKGKAFVQDKSVDLDTRWEFFIENNLGKHEPWIVNWKSLEEFDSWPERDSDYIERRETVYMDSSAERMAECVPPFDWYPEDYTEEQIAEMMNPANIVLEYGRDYDRPWFYPKSTYNHETGKNDVTYLIFRKSHYDAWREEVLDRYIGSYILDW